MQRLLIVFTVTLAFATSKYSTPTGCIPYGVRTALGNNFFDKTDNQTASIWFNTKLECPKSYITVEKESSIRKIYCNSKNVSFNNYSTYVHECSINFIQRGSDFEYMSYGWTGKTQDPAIPFSNSNLHSHVLAKNEQVKIISIADWSYLDLKASVYDRLDNAFDALLKTNQNFILYIGGDYAYDLSTNNGKNYQQFLIMLSQVAHRWPTLLITGNHEYNSPTDLMLFKQSFEVYNIVSNNVTTLDFGVFTLITFDPYGILFENVTTHKLLTEFKINLDAAPKNKPIITSSHYPLACSGSSSHCKQQRFLLKQFFDLMIDYDVVLYMGAHYHTYERIFPYQKGGNFSLIPSPYDLTKQTKYLVSIVQGIAGNDKSIVQSYSKMSNFTASVSYNHTGYGIMKVSSSQLSYQHFLATSWTKPIDSMTIRYNQLFAAPSPNLRIQ